MLSLHRVTAENARRCGSVRCLTPRHAARRYTYTERCLPLRAVFDLITTLISFEIWLVQYVVAAQIVEIEPLVTYATCNFAQRPTCHFQILSLTISGFCSLSLPTFSYSSSFQCNRNFTELFKNETNTFSSFLFLTMLSA